MGQKQTTIVFSIFIEQRLKCYQCRLKYMRICLVMFGIYGSVHHFEGQCAVLCSRLISTALVWSSDSLQQQLKISVLVSPRVQLPQKFKLKGLNPYFVMGTNIKLV